METEESRSRIQTICLLVLTGAIITYFIYWLRPVLVPLVVAVFVVSGVAPILKTLENRLGVTRLAAAFLTFLAGVVILIVFGCSLWVSVLDLNRNSEAYLNRVSDVVEKVEDKISDLAKSIEEALPVKRKASDTEEEPAEEPPVRKPTNLQDDEAAEFVDRLIRDGISVVSQAFISMVSTSLVVLIYVFFLLLGTPTEINHTEDLARRRSADSLLP